MPFKGDKPYGTDGGNDDLTLDQYPADVRVAEGGTYVGFLVINGPITIRQRSMIIDIVRILGNIGQSDTGGTLVALITRENGVIVEADTTDINASDGIQIIYIAPNAVEIKIPAGGITTDLLADGVVTALKLAAGSVGTTQLADNAVTAAKIADGNVGTAEIANGAVTPTKLDRTYLTSVPAHTHSYEPLGHTHSTLEDAFGDTYTHKMTANSISVRIAPGYEHNVIGYINLNHRVQWMGESGVVSGGDTWHYCHVENWGFGWVPWHSVTTI